MKGFRHRQTAAAVLLIMTLLTACGSAAGKAQEQTAPVNTEAPKADTPAPVKTPEPVKEDPVPAHEEKTPAEAEAPAEPEAEEKTESDAEVSPELAEFLKSYEEFVDKYVEFYAEYTKNPTDMKLLMEYTSMMTEYSKFSQALAKYDSTSMSPADAAYYSEVVLRCSQKMLGMVS